MSRIEKVAGMLKAEIGLIIQTKLSDPGLGFVTISEVRLSRDLRIANVYFTVLGDQSKIEETKAALNRARPYIQNMLAGRVHLRYLPVLKFFYDSSLEYSDKIERLLQSIRQSENDESDG